MSLPYVKKDEKGIPTLYVNDRPFFCRAGEIHNSSASDPDFMLKNVWPNLRDLHMNSVIVPAYWEMLEETEGTYDFSSVDAIILQAREEGMKLIFLWFGLWKNAESMYVPAWMKQDPEKYFRAEKVNGDRMTTISPLCEAAVEKDMQAFAALLRHIREFDEKEQTVIMFQVENEIGLLGTDRDYSAAGKDAFAKAVPEQVAALTGKAGTWEEVYGEDAGEKFMAWYFANAVEKIAAAGKKEYDLPCYVNAWLRQYPWYPGSYPMGGPVDTVQDIWRCAAPSLFAFAPDVYVPYCADVMDTYATEENPLFIPEIRKDAVTASYALYAFAGKNAIGYSPFGIEELALDPSLVDRPPMEVMIALNIDPSAFDITDSKDYLARVYRLMDELQPLYLEHRGTDHLKAFVRHGSLDNGTYLRFGKYDLTASYAPMQTAKPLGAGMVMELSPDTFLIAAMSCSMEFRVKPGCDKKLNILRLEEGSFENGEWKRERILNGDEKMSLSFGPMPKLLMVKVYQF